MIRTVTLDPVSMDPPYPHILWNEEAEKKWAMMVGKINLLDPHERIENADGTITYTQEHGPPAMRIFRSP